MIVSASFQPLAFCHSPLGEWILWFVTQSFLSSAGADKKAEAGAGAATEFQFVSICIQIGFIYLCSAPSFLNSVCSEFLAQETLTCLPCLCTIHNTGQANAANSLNFPFTNKNSLYTDSLHDQKWASSQAEQKSCPQHFCAAKSSSVPPINHLCTRAKPCVSNHHTYKVPSHKVFSHHQVTPSLCACQRSESPPCYVSSKLYT